MNKNVKAVIIIAVVLVIAFVIYKFAFKNSNMKKGYAKKPGDWVGCNVTEYDKDFYKGTNTAGVDIYFKKGDVKLRTGNDRTLGKCADSVSDMNVYTLK